jgi:septum formation protein
MTSRTDLPDDGTPRVVLASASPRRRELLRLIGIPHEIMPADIDETFLEGEEPRAHALRLAREKAATIAQRAPGTAVIGSDTIVVVDGEVLGKPGDEDEAATMLRRLSGRSHVVITAVAVIWDGRVASSAEEVDVTFRALDEREIWSYIDTREPMDKAGAYGIQGYGATIVARIDGDYFAVMGLALNRLVSCCREVGLSYDFGPLRIADATARPSPAHR